MTDEKALAYMVLFVFGWLAGIAIYHLLSKKK